MGSKSPAGILLTDVFDDSLSDNGADQSEYCRSMDRLIQIALEEDLGISRTGSDLWAKNLIGDITTNACIDAHVRGDAIIIAKKPGVLFGQELAARVFNILGKIYSEQVAGAANDTDCLINYVPECPDGTAVEMGTIIAKIKGPFRTILSGERVALNFLQRLSGVATITREAVNLVAPHDVRVLDTRKTTPGYRLLEKAAVRAGGGSNHRMGLFDEFLIKNNHIDALQGDIGEAIKRCRQYRPGSKLKVEVRDWREIHDAVRAKPDGLLLDNFSVEELTEVIPRLRELKNGGSLLLEASGGITPDNIVQYASSGIDEVSLGFLTHSAPALDISLRYRNTERVM